MKRCDGAGDGGRKDGPPRSSFSPGCLAELEAVLEGQIACVRVEREARR
jgi:hypothetical protein